MNRVALYLLIVAWSVATIAMLRTEPRPADISIDMAVSQESRP